MHIRKYDFDYGRRMLLKKAAVGASAGVLAPLWPTIANSADNISKAYPDELISIEANTKGKIKVGDTITSANVEHVKHLMDEIMYEQVAKQGRQIKIGKTTTDVSTMYPYAYFQATLRNAGKAAFDANGNVVEKATGGPWIGGNPFPDNKTALEAVANITMCWGRHDLSQYAVRTFDFNPDGSQAFSYDFLWSELNTTSRTQTGEKRYFQNRKDMLRFQSIVFTSPTEQAGASYLVPWSYDQRKLPEIYGYMPQFRRVRQFPANQRFEPLVPGMSLFLTDAWGAGDPMLTWGNYKIIRREPHLVPAGHSNWRGGEHKNWENHNRHGGGKNQSFMETTMELAPECLVIEAEPTGYPRAPVGKKRMWIDTRNGFLGGYITYDRQGKVWKQVEGCFGQQIQGNVVNKDATGHPHWSWTFVHVADVQSGRVTLLNQVKEIAGGYKTNFDPPNEEAVYERFLTQSAIARLGAV